MAVSDKVKSIIVEQLGVDEEEVTPDASFVDDLGADSLDTVELVMAFEEEFGIEIPDEDAELLMASDSDLFNRWQAANTYAARTLVEAVAHLASAPACPLSGGRGRR